MGHPLTTAYAGHADITAENASALLDQFLPKDPPDGDGLGLIFIPERVPRLMRGLKATITWLEGEVGADGTIPSPDLVADMLKRREETGDELLLFLLFDPEKEDDVALANAANDAGIPIRNLAAAGDFLVFEDETPPFDTDEVATDDLARAEVPAAASAVLAEIPAGSGIRIVLELPPGTVDALAKAIVANMANLGAAQVAAQVGKGGGGGVTAVAPVVPINAGAAEKPAEPMGRTDQAAGTSAYYYNAVKATYRKARGMAREDETKVFLTEDEAAEARRLKMLA